MGDHQPHNATHVATTRALRDLPGGTSFEWLATDELPAKPGSLQGFDGFFIAPASPYRDMEAVLEVIRFARERGVPLVGT